MICYLDDEGMAITMKKSNFVLDFFKLLLFLNCDFFEREVFFSFYLLYSTYSSETALRKLTIKTIFALKLVEAYDRHRLTFEC